jgi:DNA-binding response OmpR family regulator
MGEDYSVDVVHSAEAALSMIGREKYDAILLDIMLKGEDGITFCNKIRQQIYCPIIFTSCLNDDNTIVKAMHMAEMTISQNRFASLC